MENNTNKHMPLKVSIAVIALAAVIGGGFYYWGKVKMERSERELAERPMNVETAVTPFKDGVLNAPAGFPESIPVNDAVIVDSSTTEFPDQKATQRSIMYHSTSTVEIKHKEYADYLASAGYTVQETVGENGVISLNGTKEGEAIAITINTWEDFTRVYIAHLSTPQN